LGEGTGSIVRLGSASGEYAWASDVFGKQPEHQIATARGGYSWDSSAEGYRNPKASASGTYLYIGVAQGKTPFLPCPARTMLIEGGDRAMAIELQDRVMVIETVSRVMFIDAGDRSMPIESGDRVMVMEA
jgi:hypothetical protein